MSGKTTIILSSDNEHWYYDCHEDAFFIEIDKQHEITKDHDEKMEIRIKKGTSLFNAIEARFQIGSLTIK